MAKIVVKNGTLAFTGSSIINMDLNNVTFDVNAEVHSYDVMTEEWRVQTGGIKSWSATAETAWEGDKGFDLANTIGKTAVLTFDSTVDGGKTLTAAVGAIVESASMSAPVDGYATISWSFQGTGALGEA